MPETADCIRARRTHKSWDGSPVPRQQLSSLLDLAIHAPMHRLSNPWRFSVLDQPAIQSLRAWLLDRPDLFAWPDAGKAESKRAKICDHYLPQLGAIIHVAAITSDDDMVTAEDRDATAAAVQNILLGAESAGLAAFWSSSAIMRHPEVQRHLGRDPEREQFVASVWLGGRVKDPTPPPRENLDAVTTWIGEAHA